MSLAVHNVNVAFQDLGRNVDIALHTQIGDAARLNEHKRLCFQFLTDIHMVRISFHLLVNIYYRVTQHMSVMNAGDVQIITSSVERMIQALDEAMATSSDFPDAPPLIFGERVASGEPGRPAINIRPEDLAQLTTGRITHEQVALIYNCSTRTIRRRLLDYGLSSPGPAVYVDEPQPDGTVIRTCSAGVRSDLSSLTDDELDQIMLSIYEQFPSFGRRMIDGYLLQLGERVPRQRVINSYLRVIGPSTSTFATRRIQRRVYSVPGPNSLWHHDGQHGKSSVSSCSQLH
jgi:hypothetical protein